MNHRQTLFAGALALVLAVPSRAAPSPVVPSERAEVTFPGSDRFADIGIDARDRQAVLDDLRAQIERLARRLPDGQTLTVRFDDVDLAGRIVWRRLDPVRVVGEGPDAPRLRFQWELVEGGRVLRAGRETLTDLGYARRLGPARAGILLPIEGRLLERWFAERIAEAP